MRMNYLPPLRNDQQMVRVVKDGGANHPMTSHTYQLGTAFGEYLENHHLHASSAPPATEQRLRTLEVMALPSGSLRKPGAEHHGGILPTRTESAHFHQLNPSTQQYFNGRGGEQVQNRQALAAGTKLRTQLAPSATNKHLYKNTLTHHAHHPAHRETSLHQGHHHHRHPISH
ncbi:hypothetical protein SAMN02745781_00318 [Vibrio gazogenes DSM 21264]|uniref:Uncharacterized protein n=2 Tax=Vibrio gazogenes TaxID=687 RepID=A0A1M4THF0_VIBGA|nr:hypothetical protein [Vibrio gazogenes]USP16097.1 hypothetical protein MKS89_17070 [Vibrio gazogenes]SHE43866.1 hypothetical protein SAMN02745781_00318 [Vibrio gazogenes DSM 21264] [Vibrio gazogenes DSM 21264 = NBRC 103151]SJN54221.1 hypothetical protein BQ6471_00885 [Vibrio gazogenes]